MLPCVAVRFGGLQCACVRRHSGGERIHTLQCVAVCGSVMQCAAVCCSALQCVAVCMWQETYRECLSHSGRENLALSIAHHRELMCVAVCCSMLQCVAVCCHVLQCVAV